MNRSSVPRRWVKVIVFMTAWFTLYTLAVIKVLDPPAWATLGGSAICVSGAVLVIRRQL